MFPFGYSTIFRSRWMALLWAAGICWLAYDAVPAATDPASGNQQAVATDATGASYNKEDVDALEATLENM